MSLSIHRFAPTRIAKFGLALDLAVLVAAIVASTPAPWSADLGWACAGAVVFWTTSSVARHYGATAERPAWEDVVLTLIILLSVVTVLGACALLFRPGRGPVLVGLLLLALPAQVLLRMTVFTWIRHRTRLARQLLIVGTGPLGRITSEDLTRDRAVCSYLSWPGERVPDPLQGRYLGDVESLQSVLLTEVFDEVYLCGLPHAHGASLQKAVQVCETFGVPFALPAYSVRLGRAQPVASKAVADGFLHYVSSASAPEERLLKRLLDIGASSAALWILFPFLLVIAALVRLTSPGPVFFRQVRVGLHGKKFHMLKFRSMVVGAEALKARLLAQNEQSGPVFKMKHDPRVTPLGRFLRRYSIDELPQLVNVLRGDMTLVGPRPPVPQEVAQYEPWQRRRLSVPPGITCLWQVSGRNAIAFQDWMYLDLQYIDHWSMGRDLNLLLKTVPVVVTGRGSH